MKIIQADMPECAIINIRKYKRGLFMKRLLTVLCLVFTTADISSASALGGYDAGALNSQYMRDLRVHEAETRARNNNSAIISTKKLPKQEITNAELKAVIFINNSAVPSEELLTVIQDKINKPMSPENISAIRKDIMKYYQSKGYYSAVALIASQNDKDGELVIEIQEGGRDSIQIQE